METVSSDRGYNPEGCIRCGDRYYGLDDRDSGALLATFLNGRMLFSTERHKWFYSTGDTWQVDYMGIHAMDIAGEYAERIAACVDETRESRMYTVLREYARQWRGTEYRKRILKEASGACHVLQSEFDSDPYQINLKGGVLDWRTGHLRPRTSDDLFTKVLGAAYMPAAVSDLWERFVSDMMANDPDRIRYFRKLMAYTLTGDTRYNRIFILEDVDGDCRSRDVFSDVMAALMGSYACRVNLYTQVRTKLLDRCTPCREAGQLAGVRFADFFRSGSQVVLSPALVRGLTGGSLTAKYPSEDEFTFPVRFKAFISGGVTVDGSDALFNMEKVNVIPLAGFSGDYGKLREELLKPEHLSGNLNYCLAGFSSLWIDGLNPPDAIVKATEQLLRKPAA